MCLATSRVFVTFLQCLSSLLSRSGSQLVQQSHEENAVVVSSQLSLASWISVMVLFEFLKVDLLLIFGEVIECTDTCSSHRSCLEVRAVLVNVIVHIFFSLCTCGQKRCAVQRAGTGIDGQV